MSVQVGQVAITKRTLTQSDFDRFAMLSGDDNPIHVDPAFAAQTKFGRTVAHGMFLYSVLCGVLGTHLPGPGTLQVEQDLMFPTATPSGEEVEARVEVSDVRPADGLVELSTYIIRPDGSPGLQGRTLVRTLGESKPLITAAASPAISTPNTQYPLSARFKGMAPGHQAQTRRIFSEADLAEYVDLTGDDNPLFSDDQYVKQYGLTARIIPGGLLGGLFSFLLGTRLPGKGTNYLKQRLVFPMPAYVEQELRASVEITRIRPEKQLVNLSTICTNPTGQVVCHGEALVLVSDVPNEA